MAVNGSKPALRAPRGLSAEARERWHGQVEELEARRRLSPALRELVESWARAYDAREAAFAAWEAAGRPETERGSTGQARQHHLAAAAERAGRHFDALTAKVERSANRRVAKQRVPPGARVLRKLASGGLMILDADGRVRQQSVVDASEWVLSWDEVQHDDGYRLRWEGEDGVPVFSRTPPTRTGWEITEAEAVEWAELRDIPVEAVLEWYHHPRRISMVTVRDDVDIPRRGIDTD